jgi:hypothetical protein
MTGDRGDLRRFSDFVDGDAGIPNIADLDRDLLHGYQRHLARVRADPKAARRLCESADSPAGRNGGGRGRATGSGPAGRGLLSVLLALNRGKRLVEANLWNPRVAQRCWTRCTSRRVPAQLSTRQSGEALGAGPLRCASCAVCRAIIQPSYSRKGLHSWYSCHRCLSELHRDQHLGHAQSHNGECGANDGSVRGTVLVDVMSGAGTGGVVGLLAGDTRRAGVSRSGNDRQPHGSVLGGGSESWAERGRQP